MADPDIPLQQLDPSPIESPADASKEGYFPPHVARSSTLGLGGHSAAYYLTRIQRYSSYTFSVFLAFHITNTSLIPLATGSVSASEPYLLLTRPYYQSTIAEPAIVILPLLLHIGAGTALRLFRRHQLAVRYGSGETSPLLPVHHHHSTSKSNSGHRPHQSTWPLLSGTSKLGYAIIPLVGIHALVNRGLPLWIEGGSSSIGLSFVSHGFAKHPAVAFVGYVALIACVSGHVVWGWARWLGVAPRSVNRTADVGVGRGADRAWRANRAWYAANAAVVLVAGVWMAGGLGVVGRAGEVKGWLGRVYDEIYARVPGLAWWS